MTSNSELFGTILEYPDARAQHRFQALVGIDDIKTRLVNEAAALLDPKILEDWSQQHYRKQVPLVGAMKERTPLFVFAGDVGTGKTELAESVGDPIARSLNLDPLTLFPLSLTARGRGLVGEMTTLIVQAFEFVRGEMGSARDSRGRVRKAAILLIDEADALAQSRELAQMHHEDRAGVNALIRSIDELRRDGLPILTIMSTNRVDAIDPAIARRAARIFRFERPNCEQRLALLEASLVGTGLSADTMSAAASLLGGTDEAPWGATYSDIRQRFIPDLVIGAVERRQPLSSEMVFVAAQEFEPTRPFGANND
ncbi:MAG: AAA ATPase, central region [uncultured Chloroflexia bacterium]|uniref:AAA ATPase, central region n=1 Tax=uncultured Chloroflexia bacterium TaxID=1672391 RepID=A0A6J4MC27_9CHLR|nr:MAG: AAA ATPase, central region [uncultured Chloroflexia bacterium]